MRLFKNLFFFLTILLGFLMMLYSCSNNSDIRIRIRPNDNSKEAQERKEQVKNEVLRLLKETQYLEPMDLVAYLNTNLKESFSDISVEFTYDLFEAKAIKGKIIPSGNYPTILIKLGRGLGDNWWSILYPEYFGLSYDDSDEIEYRSFFYDLFNNKEKS